MKKLLISCLFILLMSANDAMASEVIPFTVNYIDDMPIGEDIGAIYEPDATKADTGDAYNWLLNNGYTGNGSQGYNTTAVLNSLDISCPVLIRGYATKETESFLGITYNTYYKDGHAWVIDGYQQLNRQRHFTITAVNKKTGQEHIVRNEYYTENITLLHNNWGWGGYLNNWFTAGNFNTGDPSNLVITRSSVYPSYKYELTIYPNIRPIIQ